MKVFYKILNQEKVEAVGHIKTVSIPSNELHLGLNKEGSALSKGLLEHWITGNEMHVREDKSQMSWEVGEYSLHWLPSS